MRATQASEDIHRGGKNDPTARDPSSRVRSRNWFFVAFLCFTILAFSVRISRDYLLRSIGRLIVLQQPLPTSADIIVVAIDVDGAGTLEAADLVHRGLSTRVAVFNDPPTAVDREFLRRGLPYHDWGAISTRQLQMLGVQNVVLIPRSASGSQQEGEILPQWCEEQHYHSVVLVTSGDHSRRLARIMRRSLRTRQINVIIDISPYADFNLDSWWKTRAGVREGIFELQKLMLDVLRHPLG